MIRNPFTPKPVESQLSYEQILENFSLVEIREKEVKFVESMFGKGEAGKLAFNTLLQSIGLEPVKVYNPTLEDTGLIDFAVKKNYNKRVDLVVRDEDSSRMFVVEMAALSNLGKWDDVHQEQVLFKHTVATALNGDWEVFTISLALEEFDEKHKNLISVIDNMYATHISFFEDMTYSFFTHDIQRKITATQKGKFKDVQLVEEWMKISEEEWGWQHRAKVDSYGTAFVGKSIKGVSKSGGLEIHFRKGNAKIMWTRGKEHGVFDATNAEEVTQSMINALGIEVTNNSATSEWVNVCIPFNLSDYSQENKDLFRKFVTTFATEIGYENLLS